LFSSIGVIKKGLAFPWGNGGRLSELLGKDIVVSPGKIGDLKWWGFSMKYLAAGFVAALSLILMLENNQAGEKKGKAKFTIPEVMKEAHQSKLMEKVANLKATDAEKKTLVELYTALSQNPPPKGEAASWKAKTGALIAAAKKAAEGDEKAAMSLLKLASCKGCHNVHKEDD
jgi:hypothetical protein